MTPFRSDLPYHDDAEQRGGFSSSRPRAAGRRAPSAVPPAPPVGTAPLHLGAASGIKAPADRPGSPAPVDLPRAERRLDLADEYRAGWLDDPRDAA